MGWGLFQEVPERPESHHFPFEFSLLREFKEKGWKGEKG